MTLIPLTLALIALYWVANPWYLSATIARQGNNPISEYKKVTNIPTPIGNLKFTRVQFKLDHRKMNMENIDVIEELMMKGSNLAQELQDFIDEAETAGSPIPASQSLVDEWNESFKTANAHNPHAEVQGLLELLFTIRTAAGDPEGRLMQHELVELIALQNEKTAELNAMYINIKNRLPRELAVSVSNWEDLLEAVQQLTAPSEDEKQVA